MIKTTMNIRGEVYAKLADAAARTGWERRDMVSALISRVVRSGRCRAAASGCVRYQLRTGEGQWNCLHIRLEQDEYEFFFDLRKVMKMSVSFIVSWAIEFFLDELIRNIAMGGDNYCYMNYAMYSVTIGNVFHIILCWGMPTKLIGHT